MNYKAAIGLFLLPFHAVSQHVDDSFVGPPQPVRNSLYAQHVLNQEQELLREMQSRRITTVDRLANRLQNHVQKETEFAVSNVDIQSLDYDGYQKNVQLRFDMLAPRMRIPLQTPVSGDIIVRFSDDVRFRTDIKKPSYIPGNIHLQIELERYTPSDVRATILYRANLEDVLGSLRRR
ncbi:MAG: hypothetical protein ACMXYF_03045 [Candidatus Woesearchaeota archaeon]